MSSENQKRKIHSYAFTTYNKVQPKPILNTQDENILRKVLASVPPRNNEQDQDRLVFFLQPA